MSRIVLLAPGDVISQCGDALKVRGIKAKIKPWEGFDINNNLTSEGKETIVTGQAKVDGRADHVEPGGSGKIQTGVDGSNDGISGGGEPTNQLGGNKRGTSKGSTWSDSKDEAAQLLLLLERSKKQIHDGKSSKDEGESQEKNGGQEQGAGTINKESQKENISGGIIYVLSDDIADKLEEDYGANVRVTIGRNTLEDNVKILEFGPALIKRLGLSSEVKDEQSDELKRLRRLNELTQNNDKSKKSDKSMRKTVRVDSEKGLKEVLGGKVKLNANDRKSIAQNTSRVGTVTNYLEDVDSAHVMFTAPTGDPNWKELARKATMRSNIRAYKYTPGEISLQEAFATLLDVV
ncbi:VP6 [Yonaguni orbivirus]|nr:VP6 [Yonaguni orbivirus]